MAHDASRPSPPSPPAEAVAAIRAGDRARARSLLVTALRRNPVDATAWLWLSGALTDAAEQRYCLEQALAVEPGLAPAQRGLAMLAQVGARAPVEFQHREQRTANREHRTENTEHRTERRGQRTDGRQTQASASITNRELRTANRELRTDERTPTSVRSPAPAVAAAPRLRAPSDAAPSVQPAPSNDFSGVRRPAPVANPQPSARNPQPFEAPPPSLAIWTQPWAAMRAALAERTPWETGFLGALAGISMVLAWAAQRNLGDQARPAEIMGLAVIVGPFLGLGGLVLGGVLLRSSGRWLGGRAGAGAVRAALAWAGTPLIIGLLLWLVQLVVLPAASFSTAIVAPVAALGALICGVLHLALALWAAGLSLIGLSVAHEFGIVRAVVSWALAGLFIVVIAGAVLFGTATLIELRGG